MEKVILYIHGKNGKADEAEHYKPLFQDSDVIGFDYKSNTPWECKYEFQKEYHRLKKQYKSIMIIANSIGAFFSMEALSIAEIEKAWFISPIVDMEKLILKMMGWAKVSEKQLEVQKTIETKFGETLSWEYLCYVRKNKIKWDIPTEILYGAKDNLTTLETITEFSDNHNANLTIMPNGEHWFHTKEQMQFLDKWITKYILQRK